jgi:hypothetical protein
LNLTVGKIIQLLLADAKDSVLRIEPEVSIIIFQNGGHGAPLVAIDAADGLEPIMEETNQTAAVSANPQGIVGIHVECEH